MSAIDRFEDIKAWQKARILVKAIYDTCKSGSVARDFGLKDQLCRAAVSTMSNIAEGFARGTDTEFAHFLDIARGSAVEVQSLLYVALDVGHITEEQFGPLFQLAVETARLVAGFTSYLRQQST